MPWLTSCFLVALGVYILRNGGAFGRGLVLGVALGALIVI